MSSGQRHHRTRTHLAEAVPDFRRHGIDRLHLRLDYERKQTLRRACPDLQLPAVEQGARMFVEGTRTLNSAAKPSRL